MLITKTNKKACILLHGAWHGNWIWEHIIPLLKTKYYELFIPNLPGHMLERYSKNDFISINLSTYVKSLENIIKENDKKFTLVGHSMSGVVISQLAENIPEKIEKLVYLSAFVPDNKGSIIEEEHKAIVPSVANQIIVDEEKCEIFFKPLVRIKELFYNECSEERANWAISQLQSQPLKPFIDKVNLSKEKFGQVPKFYIECLKDRAIMIEDQRRMNSKIECEIISLDADHSPFFSAVHQLSEIINDTVL